MDWICFVYKYKKEGENWIHFIDLIYNISQLILLKFFKFPS